MVVCFLKEEDYGEYNNYLKDSDEASFEYTLEWNNTLSTIFGFIPYYLISRNNDGKISGILPLFHAKSIFGKRLVSTPYAIFTGILADNQEVASELLTSAKQLAKEQRVDFLEIREKPKSFRIKEGILDIVRSELGFSCVKSVFNFSLHLSERPEEVWKKLPKGSVRWGITKARKSGMVVRSGNTVQDLDIFYGLFLQTRKWRGVPAYPYDYFKEIITKFGDNVKIYTSFFQGKPAASIFLIYHHKEVRYAFAGAVHQPEVMVLQPYHLILWEAISDACEKGYTLLNLGGATLATNEGGLYNFKKKWADTIEEVPYYYFLNKGGQIPIHDHSLLLKLASSVWARLPVSLIKLLSPKVIRQFV